MPVAAPGDSVKVHYTGKLDDGTVFDSSRERDPIEFVIGSQKVIPGFENAVVGLGVGDRRAVSIEPGDAYGEHDEAKVVTLDREHISDKLDLRPGMMVQATMPQGTVAFLVLDANPEQVTLDANHPLAGKRLHFELELVAIAAP
jgi:peptidylprolyl isomerase